VTTYADADEARRFAAGYLRDAEDAERLGAWDSGAMYRKLAGKAALEAVLASPPSTPSTPAPSSPPPPKAKPPAPWSNEWIRERDAARVRALVASLGDEKPDADDDDDADEPEDEDQMKKIIKYGEGDFTMTLDLSAVAVAAPTEIMIGERPTARQTLIDAYGVPPELARQLSDETLLKVLPAFSAARKVASR